MTTHETFTTNQTCLEISLQRGFINTTVNMFRNLLIVSTSFSIWGILNNLYLEASFI
jgi:hypothetical protein